MRMCKIVWSLASVSYDWMIDGTVKPIWPCKRGIESCHFDLLQLLHLKSDSWNLKWQVDLIRDCPQDLAFHNLIQRPNMHVKAEVWPIIGHISCTMFTCFQGGVGQCSGCVRKRGSPGSGQVMIDNHLESQTLGHCSNPSWHRLHAHSTNLTHTHTHTDTYTYNNLYHSYTYFTQWDESVGWWASSDLSVHSRPGEYCILVIRNDRDWPVTATQHVWEEGKEMSTKSTVPQLLVFGGTLNLPLRASFLGEVDTGNPQKEIEICRTWSKTSARPVRLRENHCSCIFEGHIECTSLPKSNLYMCIST